MKPVALVVTAAHWPDDTRIRERLIRTLDERFSIVYAARAPGPTDRAGLVYRRLRGGRLRRNLDALGLALVGTWDVLVLHDPELVPAGLLARLVRRKPVVLDVHEDFPALAMSRDWVPNALRGVLRGLARLALRLAERYLTITLAEPGYQRLFQEPHPVFPNYPESSGYPPTVEAGNGEVVYLGDTTLLRGADLAVAACAALEVPLRFVGRVSDEVRSELLNGPAAPGSVRFEGFIPNREALQMVAAASVGIAPLRDSPNYRHSAPTKILEYLAVGLPVVASDLPGTRELVEGLEAVFLTKPSNAADLARGIRAAMDDDVKAVAVGQAEEIRRRFAWPSDEVLSFYEALL